MKQAAIGAGMSSNLGIRLFFFQDMISKGTEQFTYPDLKLLCPGCIACTLPIQHITGKRKETKICEAPRCCGIYTHHFVLFSQASTEESKAERGPGTCVSLPT